ncbi:DUF3052 domain-containing protein [Fodinicola feengrottensis]|uniref:DUF3052 domain-containing protein n=1 Tax=Fodinicola feengrottensis TaxID=435914 RepID=A0ABP4S7S4_9ACTN|nr:DUF3052 domain-containing protein [Fodinicola feengrottensis]
MVGGTAPQTEGTQSPAERLGVQPDAIVLEIGYDSDSDDELRKAIVERSGNELIGSDTNEVVDVALLWWRDGDGDLFDALVDAREPLADDGVIWVLTPKSGRDGHVPPSDISEAAPAAGLQQTTNLNAAKDWTGSRLVTPRSPRQKR